MKNKLRSQTNELVQGMVEKLWDKNTEMKTRKVILPPIRTIRAMVVCR